MAKAFTRIGRALAGSALLAAAAPAQAPVAEPVGATDASTRAADTGARFAAPVRLQAGEKLMGENRLYPSPVFHDVNGDGLQDIVIGDLRGLMTVALRLPGEGAPRYGPEAALKAADGKELKFHNW